MIIVFMELLKITQPRKILVWSSIKRYIIHEVFFSRTLLVALVVLQIMAIAFTIIKANYDSIILNSATFGLYLSLLSFQILSKKNMFASSCSFKDHSVIGGLLNIALFERDKGFWGVTKDCLDTSFVLNLVVPAIIYYTLPATFSEWKLFWTGKRWLLFVFWGALIV